jgi:hypothetical protein
MRVDSGIGRPSNALLVIVTSLPDTIARGWWQAASESRIGGQSVKVEDNPTYRIQLT